MQNISYVLLTVHLSIFISVINQLDAQFFLFYNKFISCLYIFEHQPVKGMATYRCDDTTGCMMQF